MDFSVSSDIVLEFLEVAINLVLYTREIYPQSVFQRRKKYNCPVQQLEHTILLINGTFLMCIHPGLQSYISECVGSVRPVLEKGEIEKLVVAVLSSDGEPLEKFIFEITQMPTTPQAIKDDPQLQRMEEALRSFCLKLSTSDCFLKPLPSNCTFAVQIHVPEHVHNEIVSEDQHQAFPWIEAEKKQVEVIDPHLVPLKTLKTEVCEMQLYVQESTSQKSSK